MSGGDPSLGGQLLMVLFPMLFLGLGLWLLYDVLRVRRHGVRVPGVVGGRMVNLAVDPEPTSADVTASASVVFSFRTVDGRQVRTRQKIRLTTNFMRVGRRVTVAYDPADPKRAEIIETRSQIAGAALFAGVGGLLTAVAVVFALA